MLGISSAGSAQERPPSATDDCEAHGPPIVILLNGPRWSPAFRKQVLSNLQATLRDQGFSLCTNQALEARAPATVEIRTHELPRVSVGIEIRDRVTRKRVSRSVDLAEFPQDARALALAVASDELLRASWMELALSDSAAFVRPPPPAVRNTVARETRQAARTWLGLAFAWESYRGGEHHLGGDFTLTHWFRSRIRRRPPRWGLDLSLGGRSGLRAQSTSGSVRATVFSAGLVLLVRLASGSTSGLSALLGTRIAYVSFEGDARAPARDDQKAGILGEARIGLRASLRVHRAIKLRIDGGALVPIQGVEAQDGEERVTAATSVGAFLNSGVAFGF